MDAALVAELHPATVFAAREAEFPEQVVYLAPPEPGTVTSTGEPQFAPRARERRRRATPGVEATKGPMRVVRPEVLRTT